MRLTVADQIAADHLLDHARLQGVSALGVEPRAGVPHKVLLGSIVDVSDAATRRALVELNLAGLITLTRVDSVGLIPADRRAAYERGRFWDTCCWFDAISWDGALLKGDGPFGCGRAPEVLVPAETLGADDGAPVPMCFACADAACEAAGGEVVS
jgi:hypothetical protein